jgi:hypothetical protein
VFQGDVLDINDPYQVIASVVCHDSVFFIINSGISAHRSAVFHCAHPFSVYRYRCT